jgi:hypothetical protein
MHVKIVKEPLKVQENDRGDEKWKDDHRQCRKLRLEDLFSIEIQLSTKIFKRRFTRLLSTLERFKE